MPGAHSQAMTYIVAERAADLIRDSWWKTKAKCNVYHPGSHFSILYMFESFMSKMGKKCVSMIVWLLEGRLQQA